MTSKREKLQYAYVFFADLLTMAVSVLLAWLITDGLFGVLIPYTSTDWLQTLCLLFVAFVVTFFFFDQDKNIVTRSENEEISLSLRFNIALGLVYAGCMLLAKATMLDSRYFAVTVPAVNAVLLPFSHAILKRLLIRFQRSWGMETLVGVVTTSDRAERLISEIRKDWSRRVVGVSLLEATPAAISTRVCGVEVKATFDDFMDWIRREALDEVYVDVPMDSGESFIPYLDEMESMGLTVHFRLPLLDRIEEACCDETSAARLSRSLGRCAGGNIVTMGTVELQLRDQIAKRCMDVVGAVIGCIISIPIIAVVAIPLKLESPGPLFFKQKRVGRNGRYFYIHKLRSMYVDAEARKKELEELVNVKIPENLHNKKISRAEGDLRENGGYQDAKEVEKVLNRRRAELEHALALARGTDFAVTDTSRAAMGTKVTLQPLNGGEPVVYTILGAWDTNSEKHIVSYLSQVGKELTGKSVGDQVKIVPMDGDKKKVYTITKIEAAF